MQVKFARRRRVRAWFRSSLAAPKRSSQMFRLTESEPPRSTLAQQIIIDVARREGPGEFDRQRVLESVLAALRQLTSGAA